MRSTNQKQMILPLVEGASDHQRPQFTYCTDLVASSQGQDRLIVISSSARWTIIVADGAGGLAGGSAAASEVIRAASAFANDAPRTSSEWSNFLAGLDRSMARDIQFGETTAVVVQVASGRVHGASVGDSGACLIGDSALLDLTACQHRKPLVGTGLARPVPLHSCPIVGRLLIATDGLFKYVSQNAIVAAATRPSLETAVGALVDGARLSNGLLQDDIAIVLAEWAG